MRLHERCEELLGLRERLLGPVVVEDGLEVLLGGEDPNLDESRVISAAGSVLISANLGSSLA